MAPDDSFEVELRRLQAALDECTKERDRALGRLQHDGHAAYEALKARGHSSAKIARGVGVAAATIRKLSTTAGEAGWRPFSREVYAALDQYTRRWLERGWGLAQLRDDYDSAADELAQTGKRFDETVARARGVAPTFDLGVLFVPGLPERRASRSLRLLGDTLAGSFEPVGQTRDPPVAVVDTKLAADGDGPAQLVLQRSHPDGGERGGATGHRWLVAVSPVEHDLVDDQDLRGLLRWLLRTMPWMAADAFDRRLMQHRCLPGARQLRWSGAARNALTGLVGIPLLLLMLVGVLACLLVLLLPVARGAGRAGARLLARGFGLTYVQARDKVTLDAQVNRAAQDLAWLRRRCQKVAVVAQGQGVPVAHDLVRRAPVGTVELLVTLGSPLRRSWFARALQGHPEHALGAIGGLLAWFWGASFLLIWSAIAGLVVATALLGGDALLTMVAAAGTAALFPLIVLLARWGRRVLRSEVLSVHLRALDGRRPQVAGLVWLDLGSAADPVADGAYLAALAPLGEVHLEVTHRASAWADHRGYLRPGSEALDRLLAALARVAPPPAGLGQAGDAAAGTRHRVRWLVAARRAAVASGLVAAVVLLPRLPGPTPRAWGGVAVFLGLWAAGALVALAVLASCWRLWDYAHRTWEAATAAGTVVSDVPPFAGFALLLEMLVLAVAWPVLLVLGWWRALARQGATFAAFSSGGDPGMRVAALLLETSLALLVVFAVTGALGLLLSRPAVRDLLERRRQLPDPVAAAGLLLRLLPEDGLVVGGGRYHAAPISWEVAVPRVRGHHPPGRCPVPAPMLLRGGAVVLDLREGCMRDGREAFVLGERVYAGQANAVPGTSGPRLAGARDWRAFRRDLPALLEQVSPHGHGDGTAITRPDAPLSR